MMKYLRIVRELLEVTLVLLLIVMCIFQTYTAMINYKPIYQTEFIDMGKIEHSNVEFSWFRNNKRALHECKSL